MNVNQWIILLFCLSVFYGCLEYRARTGDTPSFAQKYMAKESLSYEKKRDTLKAFFYFMAFVSLFPLSIGLVNINQWFSAYNLAVDSKSWTQIDGVLTKKYVAEQVERVSSGNMPSYETRTYSPQAEYQFVYEGVLLQSKGIDFKNGFASSDPADAKKQLLKLPSVGSEVVVFFDEVSKRTVLNPGENNTNYTPLIIISVVLALGVATLRFAVSLLLV